MRISEVCIHRPVFASVLTLIVVLIGIISYSRLTVREYPRIDEPVVSVTTQFRGASAEVIESQVTKPLEDSLAGIEGVTVMTSQSRGERSQINVRFALSRDPDDAAADVRDKVARVRARLPDGVDEPVIAKVEADSQPVIWIAVEAGDKSIMELSDYLNRFVKPRLSVLPGAADVRIFGERQKSMRIFIDPARLASYRLTVQDVEDAIRRQNVVVPAGRIESRAREFSIVTATDLQTEQEFANAIVATVNGFPVRIRDVADVRIDSREERVIARFKGQPGLNIGVIRQATGNPLELSKAVRAEVERINENLPRGMKLNISYDTSVFIERSISAVYTTIIEAVVLVVLVIFFFLRSFRATLIPLVTIPVSLIGAFGLMYVFGFTLNTLTLLAMVLAIGMVVDDAIVVLENTYRHIEAGMDRVQAALVGAREIGFAVVAMTLTLAAVYAPLAFATGRTGRLFIEFAITLAGAVLISGFIALTLSPMMCSQLLRQHSVNHGLYGVIERFLLRMTQGYRSLLAWSLRNRALVLLVGLAVGLASVGLFRLIKTELSPVEDRGVVLGIMNGPTGGTVEYAVQNLAQLERFMADVPEGFAYQTIAGFPLVSDGTAILRLKPWEERKRSQQEIAAELIPKFASVPGVRAFPINPPSLGQPFRSTPIEYVIMGQASYQELAALSERFIAQASRIPGVQNLQSDLRLNTPEVRVSVNREKLADIGVPVDTVGRTLETFMGGRQVTRFEQDGEQYDVMIQLARSERESPSDIPGLYVRSRSGEMVQLANVVNVREGVAPQSLNHFNRLRAVTISGTLAPGASLGQVLDQMDALARETLPPTVQTDLNGQSREFRQSSGSIYLVFAMALAFIYLVLAAQFESWRNPFVIMLSVPLSITGALLALWLAGGSLSIYSQIGLITLVGLITKHGILIVEFANQLREKGASLMEATLEASVMRLRPILMTTGAMVLGAVPLALASGAGAESRQQIGWVIVGGMTLGTLFTLFVVPAVYTVLASRKVRPASGGH
jgi:multidrug efflux pump